MFESVAYCILGAGPSGLSFARMLKKLGIDSFIVLESESEPGGLCRSAYVDGFPLDIGGGHFLDVRNKKVLDFIFELMPATEWNLFQRIAKIRLRNLEVDHPLEANLWQFDIEDQIDFLESIAAAGVVKEVPEPESFSEWIKWKLGDRIADEYMLPYNRKLWSTPIDQIGTYWLHKLPSVSFRETLRSCLEKKTGGTLPAHAKFLYPKEYGYGEVWSRMGHDLGEHLRLNCPVQTIDVKHGVVNSSIKADTIVNTIPWTSWSQIGAMPPDLSDSVGKLSYESINIAYAPHNIDSPAHWIYEPSLDVPYHRVLLRHNFCIGSNGHWTETNANRPAPVENTLFRNEYAYPVNTTDKLNIMKNINDWAKNNKVLSLGRWGLWEHVNSDVAVELAMHAAKIAAKK